MNLAGGIGVNLQSPITNAGNAASLSAQIMPMLQQTNQMVSQLAGSVMQQLLGQMQQELKQAQQLAQSLGGGAGNATGAGDGAGGAGGAGAGAGTGGAGDVGGDAGAGAIGGAAGAGAADGSGMTTQSAAGALASYMSQNNIGSMDPNALYQLAQNPPAGTPPDVQNAAKFMLQNPDVFKAIETHDVAGADGVAGQGDMQWAAQGGADNVASGAGGAGGAGDTTGAGDVGGDSTTAGDGSGAASGGAPMTMQSAAGALAAYANQNGMSTVDPNALYQMAMNPKSGESQDVQNAAKFMLQNPDAFQAIETNDVKGADGLSSIANLEKAAQGEIADPTAGSGSTASASASQPMGGISPEMFMQMAGMGGMGGLMGGLGGGMGMMGGMGGLQMPKAQDSDDDNA
ncbi:hypothetical protein [Burkholderia sp. 22PA0106]|uniref:hypothetical protein n=1 Tax=Burkholderia sp. 22PA0106 TaxID=3237371 RepID=UPI0039C19EB9